MRLHGQQLGVHGEAHRIGFVSLCGQRLIDMAFGTDQPIQMHVELQIRRCQLRTHAKRCSLFVGSQPQTTTGRAKQIELVNMTASKRSSNSTSRGIGIENALLNGLDDKNEFNWFGDNQVR